MVLSEKAEFQVNEEIDGEQSFSSFVELDNGNLFLIWRSSDLDNAFTDNDAYYVAAAVFDEDGVEVVEEFQVNDFTESIQLNSQPIQLENGNILISWITFAGLFNPELGDASGIVSSAKIFDDSFDVVKSEYRFTKGTVGNQIVRNLISLEDGRLVMIMDSADPSFADTDLDTYTALRFFQSDGSAYYYDDYPFASLNTGVSYSERLRSFEVEYGDDNEGVVEMQLSPDDGITWYYYDEEWVDITGVGDATNTVEEVNFALDEFYEQFEDGVLAWRVFLVSDGTEPTLVDVVRLSENECPVVVNSADLAAVSVPENRTEVIQLIVEDPEDDEMTYSIVGGGDAGLFSIDAVGVLSISLDGNKGETYEVVVRVTDEFGGFVEQTVNVSVVESDARSGSSSGTAGVTKTPFDNQENDQKGESVSLDEEDGSVEGEDMYCLDDADFRVLLGDLSISRGEAVSMIMKLLCVDPDNYQIELPFLDIGLIKSESKGYVMAAYKMGIVKGYPDNYFRPNRSLNFAELGAILYRSKEMDVLGADPWYVDYIEVVNLVEPEMLSDIVGGKDFYNAVRLFYGL